MTNTNSTMTNIPNPLPFLIGLTGPSGSGKDTTAALLSMIGYVPFSLGAGVRIEISECAERKSTPSAITLLAGVTIYHAYRRVCNNPNILWQKPTHASIRALLQWWGTEYRRSQDGDYWIKHLIQRIHAYQEHIGWQTDLIAGAFTGRPLLKAVITDIRFPNEAAWLMSRKYFGTEDYILCPQLWHITNPRAKPLPRLHESESHFSNLPVTHTLNNDGDIHTLVTNVKSLLNKDNTLLCPK